MKARVLVAVTLMVQILAPAAALSDDDSKWASGRDGFQDFCDGITKSFTGLVKSATGGSKSAQGEDAAWGGKSGGWDNIFVRPESPATRNQEIGTIEGQKKVTESKNVVIKGLDGTRVSRRFTQNSANFSAPLKKYIDGGGSSYNAGSMGSGAGASHYYAMGSGIRGGSSGGRWGGYGESSGSRLGGSSYYGFGSSNSGAPRSMGAWGGSGSGAGAGSALGSAGRSY